MKSYVRIQVIAGVYLMIFVAALYFATGVQTGFKLDDNQLIGYVGCGSATDALLHGVRL